MNTQDFPFKISIKEGLSVPYSQTKTEWVEHDGVSGILEVPNNKRGTIEKEFTLSLVGATEDDVYDVMRYLKAHNFWLQHSKQEKTQYFVYYVKSYVTQKQATVYTIVATFVCHPTKYFKDIARHTLTSRGTIKTKGTAPAYPTITILGNSTGETSLTIDGQTVRFKNLDTKILMINDPRNPKVLDKNLQETVKWSGDFFELSPDKTTLGVSMGAGITQVDFEINWGYE